jgi:hypothetical protein
VALFGVQNYLIVGFFKYDDFDISFSDINIEKFSVKIFTKVHSYFSLSYIFKVIK